MITKTALSQVQGRRLVPGIALALVVTAFAMLASSTLSKNWGIALSPLVIAIILGAILGSIRRTPAAAVPGLGWTTKRVLRAGVVLLGLQLSLTEVADLGWRGITVIAVTVVCTFLGTLLLGRLMGVTKLTRLYVATGFSICGAAAIAAMQGTIQQRMVGASDEETAEEADALGTSLALVTIYGSLAIIFMPWLVSLVGLDDPRAGLWIGASVQEVAQVVAAASAISAPALAAATVAKLARVVLLAPLTAVVAATMRLQPKPQALAVADAGSPAVVAVAVATEQAALPARKVPPVPLFVLGFLAAVLVRSTGILPDGLLSVLDTLSKVLLTAAMFALGTGVDISRLVRTGGRSVALGAAATALAVGVSLIAVLALT